MGLAQFAGAVLTGGAGARLGRGPKALVPFAGRPLAAYPVDTLRQAGAAEILAVGVPVGGAELLRDLGCRLVEEDSGRGPLGAIVAALRAMAPSVDRAAVLGCDMPCVTPDVIRALVRAAATGDAAVALTERGPEPLLAVYRASALPSLAAALHAGKRAVRHALGGLEVVEVPAPAGVAVNVNTAEDLRRTTTA